MDQLDENRIRQIVKEPGLVEFLALSGLVETVGAQPSFTPLKVYDQFKIYNSKLWVYDNLNAAWFGAGGAGGGGAKSVTFVIGPSSNSDSSSYDYVTDGTDDNVQIQAAIDALPSTGGEVRLREGIYTLGSASVTIAKNGVTLSGVGKGTVINGTKQFILGDTSVQYSNCTITDIYFDTSLSPTVDNSATALPIDNLIIAGCYFKSSGSGKVVIQTSKKNTTILNNFFDNSNVTLYTGSVNAIISNNFWVMTSTNITCINDVSIQAVISSNQFILPSSYNATVISAQAFALVSDNLLRFGSSPGVSCIGISLGVGSFAFNNVLDTGGSANVAMVGIKLTGGSAIVNNNFIQETGIAISVTSDSSVISGNKLGDMRAEAIKVAGSYNVVSNNWMYGASGQTNNTYSHILLSSATNNSITGNIMRSTGVGNNPKYCIEESSGSDGPNIISGNICKNYVSGALLVQHVSTDVAHNITS